ncbi:MAG: UDP-N-acetylmuramate dehydrogenase [Lachnospiraceae bacterium]|nr:UDP-N-acetylmuramate dehydrogenase [Lachnospiraceae bacterium]
MNKIIALLGEKLPQMKVREDVLLSSCTSFRTGGPADAAANPGNSKELGELLALCKQEGIPCYILGNGTNVLAPDEGFRGVVILTSEMREISIKEETGNDEETGINDGTTGNDEVTGIKDGTTGINDEKTWIVKAGAGALFSALSLECAKKNLTGLEYARGIPGSVGGAVVMNAGAYGGEVKDSLISVTVMGEDGGKPFKMNADELELGYRHSVIPERRLVVLDAKFKLKSGDHDSIYGLMDELSARRREKQPLEYPSAGSTFKRPEGYFAGKLIEDAGLKGFGIGGAQVSEKHAGFVINSGGATSEDIENLIKEVQRQVFENSGVRLETEVRFMR